MSRTIAKYYSIPDHHLFLISKHPFSVYPENYTFQVRFYNRPLRSIINKQRIRIKLVQDQVVRFRKLKKSLYWLALREMGLIK